MLTLTARFKYVFLYYDSYTLRAEQKDMGTLLLR